MTGGSVLRKARGLSWLGLNRWRAGEFGLSARFPPEDPIDVVDRLDQRHRCVDGSRGAGACSTVPIFVQNLGCQMTCASSSNAAAVRTPGALRVRVHSVRVAGSA